MQRVAIGAYPDLDIVGVRSGYFRLLRGPRGELRAGMRNRQVAEPVQARSESPGVANGPCFSQSPGVANSPCFSQTLAEQGHGLRVVVSG
jgi:hypothetical protein